MFEKEITIGEDKIKLRFGSWAVGKLIELGFPLATLDKVMLENPFMLIPKIAYVGACNFGGYNLDAYDESLFFQWLDENGIASDEVTDTIKVFMNSITSHIPKEQKKSTIKASIKQKK